MIGDSWFIVIIKLQRVMIFIGRKFVENNYRRDYAMRLSKTGEKLWQKYRTETPVDRRAQVEWKPILRENRDEKVIGVKGKITKSRALILKQ